MILEKLRYQPKNTCYASAIKSPTAKKFIRKSRPKYSRYSRYWLTHRPANLHIKLSLVLLKFLSLCWYCFCYLSFFFSLCLSSCTFFLGEKTTVNLRKYILGISPFSERDIQRRIWLNRVPLTLTWAPHLPRDVAVDAGLWRDKAAGRWVTKQRPAFHIWKFSLKIFENFTLKIQILILSVVRCELR